MTVINHHLVLTRREWKAVINALDFMDVELHGVGVDKFIKEDLEELFPTEFLDELSEKIATSK